MTGWICWLLFVAPLLVVFFVVGWVWCIATDGFILARYSYELLRRKS
jgi:TM2 domain-containing membrane protein YozV